MSWENILKNDGSETDFLEYRVSKPKGEERIEIIKDIFSKVSEAGDILDAAASWTSPSAYQNITTKISNLLEEIKVLEKEAIEHHSGKKDLLKEDMPWTKKMTIISESELSNPTKRLIKVGWVWSDYEGKDRHKVNVYDNTGHDILFPFAFKEDY